MRIVGDLLPAASGIGNIGVDTTATGIASIQPFHRVHMMSGIFHDPISGTSGVLRFNPAGQFQVSLDGGRTFSNVRVGSAVTDIGVLGGAAISSSVDLAVPTSGFITIRDTAGSSPLLFAVDNQGLSGLWGFPSQGFNGRVVNALTDSNGTTSHGVISLVGASGIYVDIIGQTATITSSVTLPKSFVYEFTNEAGVSIQHDLGTSNVIVSVIRDDGGGDFQLTSAEYTAQISSSNVIDVTFVDTISGRVIIFGV